MERKRRRVQELLRTGELDAAKRLCQESGESGESLYLLGLVHDIAHEHEEVASCMQRALSHQERPEIWTYLAVPRRDLSSHV